MYLTLTLKSEKADTENTSLRDALDVTISNMLHTNSMYVGCY